MTIDYPDWHAGVGLHGVDAIIGAPLVGANLAAGASMTVYNDVINGASYNVVIDTLNANGITSASPFTKVSMIWKDAVGGNIMAQQQWFCLQTDVAPAKSNALVTGKGPTDGPVLTVIVKNLDTVNAVSVDFELIQSGRPQGHHDWRSVSNNISAAYSFIAPSINTPTSAPTTGLSGSSSGITIANGATINRINGLFSGKNEIDVILSTPGNLDIRAQVFNPEFTTPLRNLFFVAGVIGLNQTEVTNPHFPLITSFTNNSGAAVTFEYSVVMVETVS